MPNNLLLNATFYDETGNIILEIIENEWITSTDNWDIEVKGRELIIKNESQKTILCVKIMPHNEILFNHIKMFLPNRTILDSHFDETKNSGFVKLISKGSIGVQSNKILTGGFINVSNDNIQITGPTTYSGGRLGNIN